jgi:adenosylcobyric acid synthase
MKTFHHGGNVGQLARSAGLPAEKVLDFSANINPIGPPEWLRPLISRTTRDLVHYPDPDCTALLHAACVRYGIVESEAIAGNGSTEILYLLPRAFPAIRAIVPAPAYTDYARASELASLKVERIPLREADHFRLDLAVLEKPLQGNELVFLGQPNNPTGLLMDADSLRNLAKKHPATTFIVDEAFADFIDGMDSLTQRRPPNVIVLLSLTKFFAVPGLRLGLAVADGSVIARLRALMPPWSVNSFAQAFGEAALKDEAYAKRTRAYVDAARRRLFESLQSLPGLTVYPGQANYLLIRIDGRGVKAFELARQLLQQGMAVRVCENFDGLDARFFRVAVRRDEDNDRLCHALREIFGTARKPAAPRKTPAVMFQGTSSNAGKSVLTAALCRILLQDGYRVAPFKAQNMSLNSYVTRDGGEMGRAQVVQAQACRLDPDVRMNPILLKPSSDTGAQVIVLGKPVANMDVSRYIHYKPEVFKTAKAAYDALAAENDVMVLEGAGSPAEVNLKHHDIVNMHMARWARSPVLLVGDIDRGGVFASFVGTMEVLTEWERELTAGFIINRFRGDRSLLADAIAYTDRHTGKPTFGIVPYLPGLGLPEEDSVTFKSGGRDHPAPSGEHVEIALIDLPHISNFTDFDSLRMEPDVHLCIVRQASDLGNPDAVILPGSKNVISDLEYLRKAGLTERITHLSRDGRTELIGICGGFQILGREIADPYGIESGGRTTSGLGLLPLTTTLAPEKTLTSVHARHVESGLAVKGYQIHHGQTTGGNLPAAVIRDDGIILGIRSESNLIWGTYLHGIFDADAFRRWFIDGLRVRRNMSPIRKILTAYDLEPAFDRLADVVRQNLKINEIYRLMGL